LHGFSERPSLGQEQDISQVADSDGERGFMFIHESREQP
jgi:hypothetical protein